MQIFVYISILIVRMHSMLGDQPDEVHKNVFNSLPTEDGVYSPKQVATAQNFSVLYDVATFSKADTCHDTEEGAVYMICRNYTMSKICINKEDMYRWYCPYKTPFCVNGTCVEKPSNTIKCPRTFGFFPSPYSCREYFNCTDGRPSLVNCPKKSVYDPKGTTCVEESKQYPCHSFDCTGKNNDYAQYPGSPLYYALCVNNTAVMLAELKGRVKHS